MSSSPRLIQLDTTVKRLPEPVASEIDNDLVILSIQRGRYYGTQVVGKRIWSLIGEAIRVDQICDIMMQEFKVERTVCEREVLAFLSQLDQEGLIQIY